MSSKRNEKISYRNPRQDMRFKKRWSGSCSFPVTSLFTPCSEFGPSGRENARVPAKSRFCGSVEGEALELPLLISLLAGNSSRADGTTESLTTQYVYDGNNRLINPDGSKHADCLKGLLGTRVRRGRIRLASVPEFPFCHL